jgi:hypothetical protein
MMFSQSTGPQTDGWLKVLPISLKDPPHQLFCHAPDGKVRIGAQGTSGDTNRNRVPV